MDRRYRTFGGRAAGRRRHRLLRLAPALLLAGAASLGVAGAARAGEAPPRVADPALEARVLAIAGELRCVVCQNETLAASQADLAVDLRGQIRGQLLAGETPARIVDFMASRYGEFVRYRPAFNPTNALLWLGPFGLLGVGLLVLARNVGRRRAAPRELDAAERQRVAELLGTRAGAR